MTDRQAGYPSVDKPWLKYYTREQIEALLPKCKIYDYIWSQNKDYQDKIALNYFDRRISYGRLFDGITKAAKAYNQVGVRAGDVVSIISVTLPETIYSFYALNRIGAIANMIDPRTSRDGIREYLKEVDSKVVVTLDVAYEKVKEAVAGTSVDKVVIISPADSLPVIKKQLFKLTKGVKIKENTACIRWDHFLSEYQSDNEINDTEYRENECCVIVHTGGTTGTPKGVMLSNDNLNAAAEQALNSPIPLKREDVFLNIMPPFIAYGVVLGMHTALAGGWEQVVIPVFDPNTFDKVILKYKPAAAMGVPTHFDKVISSRKLIGKNLGHIKCLLVGGDKIKPEFEVVINEYLRNHGANLHISKGYSMTEASSTATFAFEKSNKVGSVGIPLPKTTVAVFDEETGEEKGYNEVGVLHIQSPTMMLGYYNKPDETELVIITKPDGSKWIYTGDYGYIDEDGIVYVEGRSKRMLIRHDGFKVFPPLIEKTIEKEKAIKNCCVVGKNDPNHSQGIVPVVYVTLKAESKRNEDIDHIKKSITERCLQELPEYAQPSQIEIIGELPLTPIGKIDYRELEKRANNT